MWAKYITPGNSLVSILCKVKAVYTDNRPMFVLENIKPSVLWGENAPGLLLSLGIMVNSILNTETASRYKCQQNLSTRVMTTFSQGPPTFLTGMEAAPTSSKNLEAIEGLAMFNSNRLGIVMEVMSSFFTNSKLSSIKARISTSL